MTRQEKTEDWASRETERFKSEFSKVAKESFEDDLIYGKCAVHIVPIENRSQLSWWRKFLHWTGIKKQSFFKEITVKRKHPLE